MNKFIAMLFSVAMFVIAVDTTASTTRSLDDGLVAYYPFNGNANDESGNGNHGTVHGATLTDDRFGQPNRAYAFNGIDNYTSVHHATSFSTQEKISFSVWVNPYDVEICPEGHGQVIAAHSPDRYEYNYWLSICDKKIRLVVYSDSHSFIEKSNAIIHSDEWYHIAFNAEKGGNVKLFVNGVEIVSGVAGPNFWNDGYHTIGDLRPDKNLLFYGILDDLRVYNRTLSDTEIQQLYNLTPNCANANITPTNLYHSSNPETGTITISAPPECSWTATSYADWATITFGENGEGDGTVAYEITANPSHQTREGTLNIAGQTFTITQEGIECSYSITPTSHSHSSNMESGTVRVNASGDCPWTARSHINWANITSGGSSEGNGTVTYAIMENTGTTRNGTLTIAGQTFTITQAGPIPPPHQNELVFTGLKNAYAVGELVTLDLETHVTANNRFNRADLWVAIELPSSDFLFMTAKPFEPFSLTPQHFRKSVENAEAIYHILQFQVPAGMGGEYTFYAAYIEEGKNPMTDSVFVLVSNLAVAETVLSDQ